jgi:hypothetical protein
MWSESVAQTVHIENFEKMDFKEDLMDAQEQHKRTLAGWGPANGLNFYTIDPSAIVNRSWALTE